MQLMLRDFISLTAKESHVLECLIQRENEREQGLIILPSLLRLKLDTLDYLRFDIIIITTKMNELDKYNFYSFNSAIYDLLFTNCWTLVINIGLIMYY